MGIFGTKKNSRTVEQQNENKKPEQKPRKYFEVFGDTLNQLNLFKSLSVTLIILAIFQTIIIVKSLKKMPLVIRVDQLGNAEAFRDVKSFQAVSPAEISNFTQYFLQYFTAHNFYTYDEDLIRAFKMMTENYQRKANDYLTVHQIIDNIKNKQLKTKLKISEIITVKDSPEYTNLKIKGTNEIRSYQNLNFFREEIFEYELSLKKVERTERTPWGLLVDSWGVSFYKK